ncbi:hypothetical protein HOY82DRAFT_652401 [Tuber indicum]|nr:hypothetical protein HOY82DRAFT_652401 [Tuber indicum]
MPSALHESASAWLYDEISDGLATGVIPRAWVRKIMINALPVYKNFKGEYAGYIKEADMTFIPLLGPDWTKKREFPSAVLESGWSEPADRLKLDARLWLVFAGGQAGPQIAGRYTVRPGQVNVKPTWALWARSFESLPAS